MKSRTAILTAAIVGLLLPATARAQFFAFGQNKIQYRKFEWRVLKGRHVDLYYYPSEADLAPVALASAEESYDTLALKFGHEVSVRIPLVVYASHVDFEQTNILPFTPPEGLLGATDFLKRRVTLPFRGNLAEFEHTLRHELTHVFQLSLSTDAYYQSPRGGHVQLPLWWTEGLAEYWSAGEDARDEMILRDLTLTGRLPTLAQLSYVDGFIVYPLGGRIHRWLAQTYGDWRVAIMYQELARHESFERAIESIYGRTLTQLNDEFQLAMRRAYYPTAGSRAPLPVLAREVATLAIKPAYVRDSTPDGLGQVVYMSPVTGYMTIYGREIYNRDAARAGRARSLVVSGRSAGLESFHPFDSRHDTSRKGLLLFSARYQDRDALVIWDLRRRKVVGRYQFPGLVSILSPAWMPDGRSVVFSGLSESGHSDLYRVTLPDGTLEPLTHDRYQDTDPAPSPDGREVVFASDRTTGGRHGAVNLFARDLATGAVRQLTSGAWVDETPSWGPDGRIYFTSDRDGVLNVFSIDTTGAGRRETSAWTGAFDAVALPNDRGLLVGGFHNGSFNIYAYPADSAARADTFPAPRIAPPANAVAWAWPSVTDSTGASTDQPYRSHYTLDIATGDVAFIPGFGGVQGLAFLMSDLLGDNMIFGSIASYQGAGIGRGVGNFFHNLNVTGVYLNQRHRVNWGIGGFRRAGSNFEGDRVVAYDETAVGALGLLRYPLTRFSRLEGTVTIERSDRTDFTLPVETPRRVGWIASNYVSFVRDNSLWIESGPIDGGRIALTAGVSSDFSNSRFDSFLLVGDLRKYLRIGRRVSFATRAVGFYSSGDRPSRVNIGGTGGLRGYPNFRYIVGSKAYMFNQELRFPVLRSLTLGFPFGDLRLPEFQGALFFDAGRAWFRDPSVRPVLGSYGFGIRLALAPLAVLRLDVGRRFAGNDFGSYGLSASDKRRSFVAFFFGYNY
ncbi:MAG: hypothetical protein ABI637_04520 [Gemmatimonadota bacterium]